MKIKVGQTVKAQGIKGEIKVSCFLDDAKMLKNVKSLYLSDKLHNVEKIRCDGNFFYVLFEDIHDRNKAEQYIRWDVYCDKENLTLSAGRYFIDDILGCRVTLDDGTTVGEVVDVLQYGAADVYVCNGNGVEVSFPVLKDLVLSVNVDNKSIVLSSKRFGEVAVTNED